MKKTLNEQILIHNSDVEILQVFITGKFDKISEMNKNNFNLSISIQMEGKRKKLKGDGLTDWQLERLETDIKRNPDRGHLIEDVIHFNSGWRLRIINGCKRKRRWRTGGKSRPGKKPVCVFLHLDIQTYRYTRYT